MKRKKKLFLLPIGVMVLFVLGLLCVKILLGTSIVHYRQYLFPNLGQITGFKGNTGKIYFYLLDEEELSEMAEMENIKEIYMETDSGEKIEVEGWTITTQPYHLGLSEFFERTIEVPIVFDKEKVITKLSIVYPDTTETFPAGILKIIPVSFSGKLCEDNVYGSVFNLQEKVDWTDPDYVYKEVDPYSKEVIEAFNRNFLCLYGSIRNNIKIDHIDFGIKGLGVDVSTVRLLQGEECIQGIIGDTYIFGEQEENKQYVRESILVDTLSNQTMNLSVEKGTFDIFVSLEKSAEFNAEYSCLYVWPVIYATNTDTNEELIIGSELGHINVATFKPNQLIDETVRMLLDERGI